MTWVATPALLCANKSGMRVYPATCHTVRRMGSKPPFTVSRRPGGGEIGHRSACHTGGADETNRPPATEQLHAIYRAVGSVSATRRIHSPPASRHTGQAGADMCTTTISLRQVASGIVHLPDKASTDRSTPPVRAREVAMPASSGIGPLLNAESTHTKPITIRRDRV